MHKGTARKGFTLIELLVVIAIIGLLSSVVLASLNAARTKAIEAKKKTELREMMTAVTRYYLDTGTVPANPVPGSWRPADTALGALVTGGYISKIATSPDSSLYYYYDYGSFYLVASGINDEYGPGPLGWHCSDASGGVPGSRYWCLNMTK